MSVYGRVREVPLEQIAQELALIEGKFEPLASAQPVTAASASIRTAAVGGAAPILSAIDSDVASRGDSGAGRVSSQSPDLAKGARVQGFATTFRPDDGVLHQVFGRGRVVEVRDGRVVVDFDTAGRKALLAGYAPLRKLGSMD